LIRHRDAEKQQRQNLKHRSRNRNMKEELKSALKTGRAAAGAKDGKVVHETMRLIGQTASAGVIHKRKASRLISRLARAANKSK
jgi:small subunit ribosomal protein S20